MYFRDLKTTLGMEFLKSKSPEMVEKEIRMFFIIFNVLRQLMSESENGTGSPTLAFKSCVQTFIFYCNNIKEIDTKSALEHKCLLLHEIFSCTLYQRQGRVEPRQVKRRPKPFKLMMKPRSELREELRLKEA